MRKGQIAIFMVIGILLLFLFIFFYLLLGNKNIIADDAPEDKTTTFIEECIENIGGYGLYKLGIQGGYINLNDAHFELGNINTTFSTQENGMQIPPIRVMENELSAYLDRNFRDCIDGYLKHIATGENITLGQYEIKTTVTRKAVLFEVKMPVTTRKADSTMKTDKTYSAILPVRLRLIHAIALDIAENRINKNEFSYDCLYDGSINETIINHGNRTLIVIEDSASNLFNVPYRFFFATS